MIAFTVALGTMGVAVAIERSRWKRADHKLTNLDAFTELLATKEDDCVLYEPFAVVVDLRSGRQWETVEKPVLNTLGGTRR